MCSFDNSASWKWARPGERMSYLAGSGIPARFWFPVLSISQRCGLGVAFGALLALCRLPREGERRVTLLVRRRQVLDGFHLRARVRESSAHRNKQLVFRSKRPRPSLDSLARRSPLDSCQILRATSCCLQFCSVSAMIPSAHPSRPRSKLQPRARLFASSTLVFRCAMTACHSRADSLL